MAIPAKYKSQKWAQQATNALSRANKRAREASQRASSPTAILAGSTPGALTVAVTGAIDERLNDAVIPVGRWTLSATEGAAIILPVASLVAGNGMTGRTLAKASVGPIMVAAYLAGRKFGGKA